MSWSAINLATPVSDAASLNQAVSVVAITPWMPGAKEGDGLHSWLAFPNAVDALIAKLKNQSVPSLFVMAVTATSYQSFANECAALSAVFPLKLFDQWQRHAETLVTIERDKFSLAEYAMPAGEITLNTVPTVKTRMKKALSQQAKASASALASADPLAALTAVQSEKASFDAGVDAALPALGGGTGWCFYADSNIYSALKSGMPDYKNTYTALVAFVGSAADLAYLREMMP